MKLPRRSEKGFTLVELLITLSILSVLATVVVLSVSQAFDRGTEQAYDTDRQTIQQVVTLFLLDQHVGPGSGWGSGTGGHYYPTVDGQESVYNLTELLAAAGSNQNYFDGGANGAIWMGLLSNSPEDGTTGNDSPDSAHPQGNEKGPYLNEIAESSSANNGNGSFGAYTWVICRDGKVYGLYWDGSAWREGFGGTYP